MVLLFFDIQDAIYRQNQYSMNQGIKKALEALANSLPPMVNDNMKVVTRVKGKDIIAAWTDTTKEPRDLEGKPIDPKLTYIFTEPERVDHLKNLKEAWRSKGQAGVDRYKEIMNQRYAESLVKNDKQAQESSNKQ